MAKEHNEGGAVVQSRELAETLGTSPAADDAAKGPQETPQC
jgi:hypothetical protein